MDEYVQQDVHMETQKQGNFLFLFIIFKNILPKYYYITLADYIYKEQKKKKPKKNIFKRLFNSSPVVEDFKMNYKTGDVRYKIVIDTGHLNYNKEDAFQICCENANNAVDSYRDAVLEVILTSLDGKPNDEYVNNINDAFQFFKNIKHELQEIITKAFSKEPLELCNGGEVNG